MSFLKNIPIATKVFGGFGIVLTLLLIVGGVGAYALYSGSNHFERYQEIAKQSVEAGRVQAYLLETQIEAKKFRLDASDKAIASVEKYAKKTLELNEALDAMMETPAKKEISATASQDIRRYISAFAEVTELQKARDALVRGTLDKIGPEMEQELSEIMDGAAKNSNVTAAYEAGLVMRDLLLMRLYASKFLVSNKEADYKNALQAAKSMTSHENKLLYNLQDLSRRNLAKKVISQHEDYVASLTKAFEAINKRNALVSDTLDTIGPKVSADVEKLKYDIKAEQDVVGPTATASMVLAEIVSLVLLAVGLVFGIAAAYFIGTGISRPITSITSAMSKLASGDKSTVVPCQEHKDEIGKMAEAVEVFKGSMLQVDSLEEQAIQQKKREERAQRLREMTEEFDKQVSEVLATVASSSQEMESMASSMSRTADGTNERATAVAAAAEEASVNVQTVATAAEELTASIAEIRNQVQQSLNISSQAVGEPENTSKQFQGLETAADRVGEVVNLISEIAQQTNLLALNATIEAARAGEAGRGFAVVAAEVKKLAEQTGKATGEITEHISAIQSETHTSANAMRSIGATIDTMSQIATSIATAIEEQASATDEIARSVNEASKGATEVTSNIVDVSTNAAETGKAAGNVTKVAEIINGQADQLRARVAEFLNGVRAA